MKIGLCVFSLALASFSRADQISAIRRTGSIAGCDETQTKLVELVSDRVSQRVRECAVEMPSMDLAYVNDHFVVPENRQFSPDAPQNAAYESYVAKMSGVFSKMKAAADDGIHFTCKDDAYEPNCRNGEVKAYVLASFTGRSSPMIYLCSSFFKHANDVEGDVSTMFHELSHYAADTEDYALDWWDAHHLNLDRAADDAYHYEQFAGQPTAVVLHRQIWLWLWPAKPAGF